MTHSTQKRKKFLINPEFQIPFILMTIGASLSAIVLFYGVTVYFFWKIKNLGVEAGLPSSHVFFRFIHEQNILMDKFFILGSVLVFIFLFSFGLLLSNRVAGPVERTKNYILKTLNPEIDSDDSNLEFRKKDYFQDLAQAVDELVKEYQKQKKSK